MRQHHLVGAHARRRWRRGKADTVAAPDLVERDFNPPGPDRLWAADVTQIRTAEGWLHLATVVDLWSRTVAGWAMGPTVNAELVGDALVMAFERRRPDRRVIHHSDRGAVYTSLAFSQRIELDQSFGGRVGSCYDNAAVESFFATVKRTRLDPPNENLGNTRSAASSDLRLHRDVLQPPTHPTTPRLPQPPRVRKQQCCLKPVSTRPGQVQRPRSAFWRDVLYCDLAMHSSQSQLGRSGTGRPRLWLRPDRSEMFQRQGVRRPTGDLRRSRRAIRRSGREARGWRCCCLRQPHGAARRQIR